MTSIKTTTLENGLRIITDRVEGVHSVAAGIWVDVGTRNEEPAHNGVAHMVEHMLFKGTKTRSTQQIAEQIEDVGGNINAYTSREVTSYHIHLIKDHLPLALDILADMYMNHTMPEDEIERERQVIVQEIGMCNDTPDDVIFDIYYETAYPDQTFGAPILGQAECVSKMARSTMQDYIDRFYTAERTVISAAGAVEHDEFVKQVENLFANITAGQKTGHEAAAYRGGSHLQSKNLEQIHCVLGFQGIEKLDDDYYAAQALAALLGGGMSSRLFQEVREKRGLVYNIFSYHAGYTDDGQLLIYAGASPENIPEVMPIVCEQVSGLAASLTEQEVQRAKAQMVSGLLMGRESMMARADQQAKHLLHRDKAFDPEKAVARIEAINVSDIARVAGRIFNGKPTLTALGDISKLESYDDICGRLAG